MRRRAWTVFLAGVLLTIAIGGCGTQQPESEIAGTEVETAETGTEIESATGAETESPGQGAVSQPQMELVNDRELNLIDDNYRTCYEVFVYSFYDSNGDGIGDLAGLTQKLDYINDGDPETDTDLGCTAIWLMPVMPSTTYHKYDVTDYCGIDPEYGTLEDFQTLVEECHKRGVNVIIDFVMNHSSSQHKWFLEACDYLQSLEEGREPSTEECPYVEYYHFSKEQAGAYNQVSETEWYYECQFWSEMPDLNLTSEMVRQEFTDIVQFWLDLGVDGFRLDAVKEFETGNTEANIEILTWFTDMVKSKKEDAYIVGEAWTDQTTYAQYYESGMDSLFDFAFADKGGIIANVVKGSSNNGAVSFGNALTAEQELYAGYSKQYINAPFYSNHDMGRSAGYYAGDYSENQTKMGHALNLLMGGCTFLYYGEELGMKGSGKDENKRLAMYWSADESMEGMCDGPKDAESVAMKYGSLEEQQNDPYSIYNFVKQAIKLRNIYPEISHGQVELVADLSNENICVLKKYYEDSELLMVFNLSQEKQEVDLSTVSLNGNAAGELSEAGMLQTTEEAVTTEGNTVVMPAYSVVLYQ